MGAIAIVFFELALIYPRKRPGTLFIALITGGLVLYELTQYILPGRNTGDWRDIVATVFAGGISWGIYELAYKIFQPGNAELGGKK